jgi:ABC-type multidrug transport system ATPase subunit
VPDVTTSTPEALWASRTLRHLRPTAIACRGLRRRAGGVAVLDGLDLIVPVGARLLVASRVAASATMLLRILGGMARPDQGTVRLAGLARADDEAGGWARRVGYVGPVPALPGWMSGREALELSARLLGFDHEERPGRIERAMIRAGLSVTADLDRPLRRAPMGHRELVALAAALVADPEILVLDEPLRALDPWERWRILGALEPRTTLVVASRNPAAEEGLVRQVALISQGRLAVHAPVTELTRRGLPLTLGGLEQLAAAGEVPSGVTAALRGAATRAEAR